MQAIYREAPYVVEAYRRWIWSRVIHRLFLLLAATNPVNPVYRRFLGCSWTRVEDCYPYPCYPYY